MKLLIALLAATTGCSVYQVHRSILTPPPTPPMRSGQPIDGTAQVSLGSSSLVQTTTPSSSGNDGDWIPRWDLDGAIRFPASRDVDVGVVFDSGFNQDATAAIGGPRPNGNTFGAGFEIAINRPLDQEWRLMIDLQALFYSLPFVEYDTCVSNCNTGEPYSIIDDSSKSVMVGSIALIPSWHRDRATVFGGLTVRNHPTVVGTATTVVPGLSDGVHAGPAYVILSAGVEYKLTDALKALALVYMPVNDDPIQYGPTFGLSFSVDFPRAVGP
jgi:hypothetical protein